MPKLPEAVQALVTRAGIIVNVTPKDRRRLEAILLDRSSLAEEKIRIVLEGHVRGSGLTFESGSGSGSGWKLRFHLDRGVTRPPKGRWIRVEGLVVCHADRLPPLSTDRKKQPPPRLQSPVEHLSLIRVHWNPAVPPKRRY